MPTIDASSVIAMFTSDVQNLKVRVLAQSFWVRSNVKKNRTQNVA